MKKLKKTKKDNDEDNGNAQAENSALEELPPGFEQKKQQFYIKTIQFFDDKAEPLTKPILVEQIFNEFNENRIYDVSIIQFKDKVYFFKRLYYDQAMPNVSFVDEMGNDNSMVKMDASAFIEDTDTQNIL
jgi:hypothetical protein